MYTRSMNRKHIWFSGQVQGVGFRWKAKQIANTLGLTGWCRNDMDGRVEMEIQGKEETIQLFLTQLTSDRSIVVQKMDVHPIPIVDDEKMFDVKFWW